MTDNAKTGFTRGRPLKLSLIAVMVFFVPACSSNVTRAPEVTLQNPQFNSPGKKAGNLSVHFSEDARKEATENLKFDIGRLRYTVRRALELKDLLSKEADASLPHIQITVTSVRARSNFTAVMFGFLAGDDHIDGDVIVRAPGQQDLQRFSISASYALGGLAGGQDSVRMDWLYENFAERVVEELTGRPKSE